MGIAHDLVTLLLSYHSSEYTHVESSCWLMETTMLNFGLCSRKGEATHLGQISPKT